MRRFLALAIVLTMLFSLMAVAAVPVSADDGGEWNVYANSNEFRDDFDPIEKDMTCVPGYKYVLGEGLKVTSAGWTDCNPKFGIQSKEKVDLTNGVYMLIRIDAFSFDATDGWFTFSISDTQYVSVGSQDKAKDGERITAMVRPDKEGKISSVQWNYSNFQWSGTSTMTNSDSVKYDENGNILLALSIKYDYNDGYTVSVNGAQMPKSAKTWMDKHFAEGEAYVGINMQNNKKGGTAECTLLKYGVSYDRCATPVGYDSAEPVVYSHTKAPIADRFSVEEGKPAIVLNGSREDSDAKSTVKNSGPYSLTEENYIHYTSPQAKVEISISVKNEVSYAITDFPYVLVMTRNLCSCGTDKCFGFEMISMYIMTGESIAAGSDSKVSDIGIAHFDDGPYVTEDGVYHYYLIDMSDYDTIGWEAEGRINAVRFDTSVDMQTLGRNEFDICFVAFFDDEYYAHEYAMNFISGDVEESEPETTEPEVSDTEETDPEETEEIETEEIETEEIETEEIEDTDVEEDENLDTDVEETASESSKPEATESEAGAVTSESAVKEDEDKEDEDKEDEDKEDENDEEGKNKTTETANKLAGDSSSNEAGEQGCFGSVGTVSALFVAIVFGAAMVAYPKKKKK